MGVSEVMYTYLLQLIGTLNDLVIGTFNSEFIKKLRDKLKDL